MTDTAKGVDKALQSTCPKCGTKGKGFSYCKKCGEFVAMTLVLAKPRRRE